MDGWMGQCSGEWVVWYLNGCMDDMMSKCMDFHWLQMSSQCCPEEWSPVTEMWLAVNTSGGCHCLTAPFWLQFNNYTHKPIIIVKHLSGKFAWHNLAGAGNEAGWDEQFWLELHSDYTGSGNEYNCTAVQSDWLKRRKPRHGSLVSDANIW